MLPVEENWLVQYTIQDQPFPIIQSNTNRFIRVSLYHPSKVHNVYGCCCLYNFLNM